MSDTMGVQRRKLIKEFKRVYFSKGDRLGHAENNPVKAKRNYFSFISFFQQNLNYDLHLQVYVKQVRLQYVTKKKEGKEVGQGSQGRFEEILDG